MPLFQSPDKNFPAIYVPLSLSSLKSPTLTSEIQYPTPPFSFCPNMSYITNVASLCLECSYLRESPVCIYFKFFPLIWLLAQLEELRRWEGKYSYILAPQNAPWSRTFQGKVATTASDTIPVPLLFSLPQERKADSQNFLSGLLSLQLVPSG